MDMDMLWEEYRLEDFERGISSLFPESRISLDVLLDYIFDGKSLRRWDIWGKVCGTMVLRSLWERKIFLYGCCYWGLFQLFWVFLCKFLTGTR